jgi:hypothetical protein
MKKRIRVIKLTAWTFAFIAIGLFINAFGLISSIITEIVSGVESN